MFPALLKCLLISLIATLQSVILLLLWLSNMRLIVYVTGQLTGYAISTRIIVICSTKAIYCIATGVRKAILSKFKYKRERSDFQFNLNLRKHDKDLCLC